MPVQARAASFADAVLVVDSDFFPSRATAAIALIRRITDKPVRYLANTHWHGAGFRQSAFSLRMTSSSLLFHTPSMPIRPTELRW